MRSSSTSAEVLGIPALKLADLVALPLDLNPHALDLASDELDVRHPQPSSNKKDCEKWGRETVGGLPLRYPRTAA